VPKFRNRSGGALVVGARPGRPEALEVASGEWLRVSGEVVETADAYVVGVGDKARAYPKKVWELEKAAAPVAPVVKEKTIKAVGDAEAAPKEK
jgi:hypothetical protein